MSQRQYVELQNRNLSTEHILLSDAKRRIADGELEWIVEYRTAQPILKASTESYTTPANKLCWPRHIQQWIWKHHFGYTQIHFIPREQQIAT